MSSDPVVVDQTHLLGQLRRNIVVIVVCALLGALAGAAYALLAPQSFSATAQVLLARPASDAVLGIAPNTSDNARRAANEFQILSGDGLRATAEERLGRILDVDVSAVEGSDVAEVTATASSRSRAVEDANGYARVYVDQRNEDESAAIEAGRRTLDERLAQSLEDLRQVDEDIQDSAALPDSSRAAVLARLTPIRDGLLRQQVQTRDRLESLALRGAVADGGARLTSAVPPRFPDGLSRTTKVLLGLLLGLLLGTWLATARGRRTEGEEDRLGARLSGTDVGSRPLSDAGIR